MKDRETNQISAEVVESVDGLTLQGFVLDQVADGAKVYTDDHRGYHGLPNHQSVKHSVGEYVDGMAHTNGIESFWSMLKRGYHGTYHKMSEKHLGRYVNEFSGRHNARSEGHSGSDGGHCPPHERATVALCSSDRHRGTSPCRQRQVTCSDERRDFGMALEKELETYRQLVGG